MLHSDCNHSVVADKNVQMIYGQALGALRGQIYKSVPASEICSRLRNGKVISDSFLSTLKGTY